MLKIGEVFLNTYNEKYAFVWYSDNSSNERIDVIENLDFYNNLNTSNCVASIINGRDIRVLGDINIITILNRIRTTAAFLHVAEKQDVKVVDGKFVMETSKEQADIDTYYKIRMVNGTIDTEYYKTPEGEITIDTVQNTTYSTTNKPINWEEYELQKSVSTDGVSKKAKTEQAEFRSYEELLRLYPQVSHVLSEENDYVVITSYEEARLRLDDWINSKEQLKSVDIESLDRTWGPTSNNRITGVFLGYGTNNSTYFPFRQQNFSYNLPLEFLREIFNAVNNQPAYPQVIILSHNSKFEIQGFYQEFRDYLRVDIDTYLLAVLVDPLIKKGTHTLKNLTSKVDNKFYLSLEDIFIGPVKFNVLPPNIVKLYGCPDATSPAKIYPYLLDKLPKDELFVMHLEMQLPVIKAMQEFYGIRMKQDRLLELIENEEYKVNKLGDLFKQIHHTSRNINSNDVLTEILYNKLRCKVEVRTNKGAPATSKAAIDRIIQTGYKPITEDTVIPKDILDKNNKSIIDGKKLAENKYPSLVIYQTYKKCGKELGALKRLRDHSVDGFFKFYINQVGAGSNRQTSDAHQFSDTMKSCAVADSPHHQLVSCDWKQVELRILAGMAGQKDLIELEKDPNVDIHRAILSIIQGKPMYMISEEDRKKGKSVNFGVVYMMSEYGLAVRDFGPAYTRENLNEERKKITDFFNGLPYVKALMKGNEEFLKKNGYIKTAFNYYRYFRELLDPTCDPKLAKSMIRSGNNTPIQGTGAQMLKIVETKVWEYIRSRGWDKEKEYDGKMLPMVRMILPIHDEILLSYDKTIPMEEIIKMFKECMELDIDNMPPFFAAPAFIDNWYDGKNSVYEVDIPFRDKIVEEYEKGNYLLTGKDYVNVLIEYRNNEIRDYMERLISKYKTVDEVAKHVTDDSLTHTLIETLIPNKKERGKLSHVERIYEAVRRYMQQLDSEGLLQQVKDRVIEEDDTSQYMDIDEWSTTYTHIDANGDLVTEDIEGDYEDNTEVDDDLLPMEDRQIEELSVLFLLNECIIDVTNLEMSTQAEYVHQGIRKLNNPNGYYKVIFVNGYKSIETEYRVDYIEKEIKTLFEDAKSIKVEV